MTTLDLSPYFSNAPTRWELVGTWPTGLSITPSGVVSGTTTDSGLFAGVQVRCKNDYSAWAYSNTFNVNASKFAALVPNVNYEMKGVEIGTGGLTTTHTSTLYAPDHEGVYREFGANEPVWSGGRVVNKYSNYTKIITITSEPVGVVQSGTAQGDTVAGVGIEGQDLSPYSLGINGYVIYRDNEFFSKVGVGQNVIISAMVKSVSGPAQVRIRIEVIGGTTLTSSDIDITDQWSRITFNAVVDAPYSATSSYAIRGPSSGTADVYVMNLQAEILDGDVPSEYTDSPDIAPAFGDWVTNNSTLVDQGSYWELTATGSSAQYAKYTLTGLTVGRNYVLSASIYSPSSNTLVHLGRLTGNVEAVRKYVNAADAWRAVAISVSPTSDTSEIRIQIANNSSFGAIGDLVRFRDIRVYEVRSKTYASTNGNTVLNNVVTEAVGTPLAEMPYLQYYPAAENAAKYSNNLTVAATWIPSNGPTITYDQVGLTGEPNTASLLVDSSASYESINQQVGAGIRTVVLWIKKTGSASYPGTQVGPDLIILNTLTGAITPNSSGGLVGTEAVSDGDWWKFMIQTSDASNQANKLYGQVSSDGISISAAAQGSAIIGNVEIHYNKTIAQVRGLGPIFTTTAAVSTDLTVYSLPAANFNADQAVYIDLFTQAGSGAEVRTLLTQVPTNLSSGYLFNYRNNATLYGAYKNTSAAQGSVSKTITNIADTLYKLGLVGDSGDVKFNINSDGVWATASTDYLDYSLYTTPMNIGSTSTSFAKAPFKVRGIQGYSITSYAEGETIINGLMA